jgi:pilus assembly protein CpaB
MMTSVILDSVKVLAIDQVANEKDTQPVVGHTAVLEVDLYGAQKLALSLKLGEISLALRNVAALEQATLATVTPRDLGAGGPRAITAPARRPVQVAGIFAPRVPVFPQAAITQPSASPGRAPAPVPQRPTGSTMTIYRGIDQHEEQVGRLGGS